MLKIFLTLLTAVFAVVLAAKLSFNATTHSGSKPVNPPWAHNSMEFVTWNGEKWTTWIRADMFEQTPQDKASWSRHANASIAYTDWDGQLWQAKIDDEAFVLALRGDWAGPVERSAAIRYRDWSGVNQLRTVAQLKR